jgi:peptidyl-prolyl cis-trans isomerase SurA
MRPKARIDRPAGRRQQAVDLPMRYAPALPIALRRLIVAMALAVAAGTATAARVEARMIAVIVNGEPVTNYDVEQRTKLNQLTTQKSPPRQEVLEELINEKLKIQLLRRYQIADIDRDVENAYTNMARRMRATPKQLTDQLGRSGVMPETLKARIKADLIWTQIIRGRYQSSFQFSDKDILARLEDRKSDAAPTVGYDYTLRPILFVVPRGSPPAALETRRKEAEALRARFQSCEQDIPYVRALPYVAVRPPVVKSTAELPQALRELLEKTELGRLTAPDVTQQGIEVYALCAKKQSAAENEPAKREIREQLYKERFENHSKRYLKELRSQAMIEYP